jgi:hypothetical protein
MDNELQEFDQNKVIAEFIKLNLDDFFDIGKDILKGTKENIQIKLRTVYSKYLKNITERYGKSKSFFIRDEPQELSKFYVPVGIQSSKIKIKTANIRAILSHNSKSIISGTAGSGKSILLKHLLLDAINLKKQVPIFIELRDNNFDETTLLENIHGIFECFGLDLELQFIKKAFAAGQFILFLDGLDEVKYERREIIVKEIDSLIKEYPKTSVIITTRPDNLTNELQTFSIYQTLPLSKEQSISLVEKLQADEQIKSKFINDLKGDLYEKHSSFLSNPLLLTIMLLTYGYSTDIPNKLSVFYNQAFEALFQRHDTMKGAYKRVRETSLDIQDFSKILSIFCIQTYDDRKIQFSKHDALIYLNKSKELVSIKFDSEAFLNDLLQSVCILIEDGLFITFSHRSFQEFFTALFITNSDSAMKLRLLNKYQSEILDDNVYKLCHELDSDFLEYEIIYPFLQHLMERLGIKKNIGVTHYTRFSKLMWTRFFFRKGVLLGTSNIDAEINNVVRFIVFNIANGIMGRNYFTGKDSDWIKEYKEKSKKSDSEIVFKTNELTAKDKIIIELYKGEGYFSKKLIELLVKVKTDLENKRENRINKLEEFLFNKG